MKKTAFICLCLAILCSVIPAAGQIVNVESARMQSDTTGWMGGAGLGLSLRQSKEKIFGVNMEAHLQYKTKNDKGLWLILGSVGFLRGGNLRYVNDRFVHLRYNYKVNDWLRWEVFGQVLNNVITQIRNRWLVGTGPRFKIVKTSELRLYAASLIMLEKERDITNPVIIERDVRSSSYVSFTFTPKKNSNIELISTTFFQPRLDKLSDYRILNEATLKVRASKHFSLSMRWEFLYDRFPAGNSPTTTYNLGTGLTAEL